MSDATLEAAHEHYVDARHIARSDWLSDELQRDLLRASRALCFLLPDTDYIQENPSESFSGFITATGVARGIPWKEDGKIIRGVPREFRGKSLEEINQEAVELLEEAEEVRTGS